MCDHSSSLGAWTRRALLIAAALSIPALPAASFAGDFVFTGTTSTDYNTGTNWNPGTVPATTDRADIAGGLTASISASPASAIDTLYVGANTDGPTANDGSTSSTNGNGVLTQTAGSLVVNTWAVVGEASVGTNTGTGTYNLSGGSFTLHGTDAFTVGQAGTGTFNVSGNASVQIDSTMNVGRWSGTDTTKPGSNPQGRGVGTVVLSGTSTTTINGGTSGTESLAIGRFGDGTLTLKDNATLTSAKDINVALGSSATGILNQTGGTLNQTGGWFYLGNNAGGGNGTYNLSGGTAHIVGRFLAGAGAGSTGTVNQTGGTLTVDGDISVADQGIGNFNLSAGTVNGNGGVNVGGWNTGNGHLTVSATGTLNTTDLTVSRDDPAGTSNSTGVVTQTGGTVNVSGHLVLGSDAAHETNGHTNGTYTLSGGTLNLGTNGLQLGDPNHAGVVGTFNMQGGILNAHNSGLLITTGAGSSSAFVYTGGAVQNLTTIDQEAGTVELGAGTSPLALAGDGTHSFTLGSAGTLRIDISGTSAGKMTVVNGAVTLAGLLGIHEMSFAPTGTQYTVIDRTDAGAVSGAFSNAPEGGLVLADDGQPFKVSYIGGDGNDVVLTAAVPEPTTFGLLGIVAAGLLARRRRVC